MKKRLESVSRQAPRICRESDKAWLPSVHAYPLFPGDNIKIEYKLYKYGLTSLFSIGNHLSKSTILTVCAATRSDKE